MTRLLLIALGALASACAPPAPARCDVTFTREVAFTAEGARDVISTRSLGAACDQAIGVYTITTADGHPVWAYAVPLARAFGDHFAEPEPEAMRVFLERWAEPDLASTGQAPSWTQLTPGQSTLDRLTYNDIRARNLPMLCHYAGTGRQLCVFWEPGAGGAGHYFDREIAVEDETQ
jgi:hypothetical protein